jgi:hypothetical protein
LHIDASASGAYQICILSKSLLVSGHEQYFSEAALCEEHGDIAADAWS